MRGETFNCSASSFSTLFQSTPLMRGETPQHARDRRGGRISIHSPHARGDLWEADCPRVVVISIHSPHARGDRVLDVAGVCFNSISIHSPHARGDPHGATRASEWKISIHSPHARGDDESNSFSAREKSFQSTPLMRGETPQLACLKSTRRFQSTPLMRGETVNI